MPSQSRQILVFLLLGLAAVSSAAALKCPTVFFHVDWLERDGQRYSPGQGPAEDFRFGETIELGVGDRIRLDTRIDNPNRRSGALHPEVAYEHAGQTSRRLFAFESDANQPAVQKTGAIDLRVQAEGSAMLIYAMKNLDHPSQRETKAALGNPVCGNAQVHLGTVSSGRVPSTPDAAAGVGAKSVDLLFQAILLRPVGAQPPQEFVAQLESGKYSDLLDVARQIANSRESLEEVPRRLSKAGDQGTAAASERTSRLIETLIGKLDLQDPLWTSTFQRMLAGKVADAVDLVLRDSRFLDQHRDLVPVNDLHPKMRTRRP